MPTSPSVPPAPDSSTGADRSPPASGSGLAAARRAQAWWLPITIPCVWLIYRLWMLTIRLRIEDPAGVLGLSPLPIFAFFHGRQFALPQAAARRRIAVLTSLSRDGALLAGVLRMQGLQVARGSSSRGGAAGLVTLLHQMSGGAGAALAVDGPRGPAEAIKPGVFALAEQTGRPIIPTGIAYSRAWRLRGAWDGFRIPSPFSRITVRLGQPFHTTGDPAQDPVLLAGAIRALQNDDG